MWFDGLTYDQVMEQCDLTQVEDRAEARRRLRMLKEYLLAPPVDHVLPFIAKEWVEDLTQAVEQEDGHDVLT